MCKEGPSPSATVAKALRWARARLKLVPYCSYKCFLTSAFVLWCVAKLRQWEQWPEIFRWFWGSSLKCDPTSLTFLPLLNRVFTRSMRLRTEAVQWAREPWATYWTIMEDSELRLKSISKLRRRPGSRVPGRRSAVLLYYYYSSTCCMQQCRVSAWCMESAAQERETLCVM